MLRGSGPAGEYAVWQAALLTEIADRLSDDGAALVISHGGIVEAGAVALLPDADHESCGEAIGYVEWVRLQFSGGRCTVVQMLRVPSRDYLVEN